MTEETLIDLKFRLLRLMAIDTGDLYGVDELAVYSEVIVNAQSKEEILEYFTNTSYFFPEVITDPTFTAEQQIEETNKHKAEMARLGLGADA